MESIEPSSPLSPSSPLKPIKSVEEINRSCEKVIKLCLPYGKFSHTLIGPKTNIPHKLNLFFVGVNEDRKKDKIRNKKRKRNLSSGLTDVMSNNSEIRASTGREEYNMSNKGEDCLVKRYIHSSQSNYPNTNANTKTNKKQKHHKFLEVKTICKYHENNNKNRDKQEELENEGELKKQEKERVEEIEGERRNRVEWNYLNVFYKKIIEKEKEKNKQENYCLNTKSYQNEIKLKESINFNKSQTHTNNHNHNKMYAKFYHSNSKNSQFAKIGSSLDKNGRSESYSKDKISIVKGRLCLTSKRFE